jgi:hypothetical protein
MKLKHSALPLAVLMVLLSCAVHKKSISTVSDSTATVKADTTKKDTVNKMKAYNDVITAKAVTRVGLIKLHQLNERWYFEIADTLLNRDILVVNRISKAAAGTYGYGGDWIGENVIRFAKGARQKLFIQRMSYRDKAMDSSENGMYRSVLNSSMPSIMASFDIKAFSPDSTASVIDVTDYLNGDNEVFFFDARMKKDPAYELAGLQADKSYIKDILSFPLNTEIKTVKTYMGGNLNQLRTYELNSSLILLPSQPMSPRYFDDRVGYFSRGYLNYDAPQQLKVDNMITRWRLQPRKEDMEKYKRGELVEPVKPIIFYIDPATPKKWVPWLIEGVDAWQKAFEKAGFKNAIYAREVPAGDTSWSLEDARHNVIVYKASPIANASGPQVSDPRSGEILESHINWYHNVQQILHDWYFIQAAPNDPAARSMDFDDALMGRLIRMVCTHEVGHTLGLMHNFVASSTVPTDSLRSKTYVAINGHTPSIMDYARFNYVAQPEDGINVNDLIPRIGVYDEWAIEWGYRWLPVFSNTVEEKTYMNNWIISRLKKEPRLFYSDPYPFDPRNQMEDLGDNPMKAGYYGIKNLQRIMAHIKEWTATPNSMNYRDLSRMHAALLSQYRRYIYLVSTNIAGLNRTPRTVEENGEILGFIPKEKQREAVRFLSQQVFDTPKWLDDRELFPLIGGGSVIWLEAIQETVLHQLVNASMWNALIFNEMVLPKEKAYTFTNLLDDLETNIWKELKTHEPISIYRRSVQKIYVYKLIAITRYGREGDMSIMDAFTIATIRMQQLQKKLTKAIAHYTDADSRNHLIDLSTRLRAALDYQQKAFPNVPPTPSRGLQMGWSEGNGVSDGYKEEFRNNVSEWIKANNYATRLLSTESPLLPKPFSCWVSPLY